MHTSPYIRSHEAGELSLRAGLTPLRRTFSRLFLVMLTLGSVLLGVVLWQQWQYVVDRNELRQRALVSTLKSGMGSILAAQEVVLNMLGQRLVDQSSQLSHDEKVALLDRVRSLDRNIAAYGLVTPDGRVRITNSDFDVEPDQSYSLMDQKPARKDFQLSLTSNRLQMGAPYFVEPLGEVVIPIRIGIQDQGGNVVAAMTAGLRSQGPNALFPAANFLEEGSTLQILRGRDFQPLYWASPRPPPTDYFAEPLPAMVTDSAIESAEELNGLSIEQIEIDEAVVPYRTTNDDGLQLGMAVYDSEFDFWVLEQTDRNRLIAEFWSLVWLFLLIYIVVFGVLYVLLMRISNAEQRRRHELLHQAEHDVLTGLGNRLRMNHDFERLRKQRSGRLALMFIDLDNFKAVNDAFGHETGDRVLAGVGEALLTESIGTDCITRVGGDEFVLLTKEVDRQRLEQRAFALSASIRNASHALGRGYAVGCGIGIARAPEDGEELGDLLRAADAAMYEAKKERNAVRFHDPAMSHAYFEDLELEQRLKEAIEQRALTLALQPQVDHNGAAVGLEALARWHDDEFGHVPPPRFIALAESAGLIGQLGELILDLWIEHGHRLDNEAGRKLLFSFNVSARQFRQPHFVDQLIERLENAAFRHVRPVMEITESLFMDHDSKIISDLQRLRQAGVRISIDDFGTGFSSLSRLQLLPLDEIKIDKSFVDRITEDRYTQTLIGSIVNIGLGQQLNVVAEGVETQAQREQLQMAGCTVLQGYLFSRPLPLEEFCQWLTLHQTALGTSEQ